MKKISFITITIIILIIFSGCTLQQKQNKCDHIYEFVILESNNGNTIVRQPKDLSKYGIFINMNAIKVNPNDTTELKDNTLIKLCEKCNKITIPTEEELLQKITNAMKNVNTFFSNSIVKIYFECYDKNWLGIKTNTIRYYDTGFVIAENSNLFKIITSSGIINSNRTSEGRQYTDYYIEYNNQKYRYNTIYNGKDNDFIAIISLEKNSDTKYLNPIDIKSLYKPAINEKVYEVSFDIQIKTNISTITNVKEEYFLYYKQSNDFRMIVDMYNHCLGFSSSFLISDKTIGWAIKNEDLNEILNNKY